MDIVYRNGKVTAAEVHEALPDKPTNATVRKLLSILEKKGLLKHKREGHNRYVYYPIIPVSEARDTMLDQLMTTFFKGSAARTAITLLKKSEMDLTEEERTTIIRLIEASRKRGK
ncbi:MAG: BlaI/MecI/CopY family transcriptional regulator [bacterium]|nr:MAG: BlaI/MecI/CopY family transcriptional regulator [bacterium]